MTPKLFDIYNRLKEKGLTPDQEERILGELRLGGRHEPPPASGSGGMPLAGDLYAWNDLAALQGIFSLQVPHTTSIRSLEELLERDRQREKDGFPRKIRVGRLIRPGKEGKGKVVIVPTTVEEKFVHDRIRTPGEGQGIGGSGEGEEGEVIGEQPVRDPDQPSGGEAGQGQGQAHELESSAYDLGKILTEKFALPNLKDKGKKSSLTRYTYELTDKNRGFGQILDKKATLRKILETNRCLGNLPDAGDIDSTGFLIAPRDKVYRILSRERDYESQALVFFLRDYSGSMAGRATELIVSQHVLIYSWLLYQYARQVDSRFILHDTDAREVPDFYTYYNSRVAGGTRVSSAYRLVNEMVEKDNLARDYNIYVFHGTDGDDWDTQGQEAVGELDKMLIYANRVGVTVAEHSYGAASSTEVERYLKGSGLLESRSDLLRLDVMDEEADEARVIDGIRKLIS
jgi:uncharacterized sporulation protein YeaH/YhbH (DUF444 family)